jgi:VanZ family protein
VTIGAGVAAVLLSAAYGATDEFHQRFVPGRTADLLDLAADTAGAAAAVAVVWLIARWRRRAP